MKLRIAEKVLGHWIGVHRKKRCKVRGNTWKRACNRAPKLLFEIMELHTTIMEKPYHEMSEHEKRLAKKWLKR